MQRPFEPLLSVVVPCFHEQEVLRETHRRLSDALRALGTRYEIIYVDDGSRDTTPVILHELQRADPSIRVIQFSRNFGHQIAVSAGMDFASGDAVVLIDADLQDPPELIAEFLDRWKEGFDVVYGQRTEREGESIFKRATASLFYQLLRALTPIDIPRDTGDFRLMDRGVVEALRRMPEQDRFIRGMVSWVGFRQTAVPYRREARFAGVSKYPLKKMLRLASDAIIAFSPVPLRLMNFAGLTTVAVSLMAACVTALLALTGHMDATLGPVILTSVLFLGGVQLLSVGLIGEYISRIYRQVQDRPLYIVQSTKGFGDDARLRARAA